MVPWDTIKSEKFRVRFGIGFGAAFVVFGALLVFEYSWLTAGERIAAQSALTAIDGFRSFDTVDDDDFVAKVQEVQATVENARQTAATFRDQQTAFALSEYLGSIEIQQETIRAKRLAQQSDRGFGDSKPGGREDNALDGYCNEPLIEFEVAPRIELREKFRAQKAKHGREHRQSDSGLRPGRGRSI